MGQARPGSAEEISGGPERERGGAAALAARGAAIPAATHHGTARLVAESNGQRAAAVAGETGAVLARAFCDEHGEGARGLLDVAAERTVSPARHGELVEDARRGCQGSRDAHLAGSGADPQG